MSDTQYTADELRAHVNEVETDALRCWQKTCAMLRAGADAMELADYRLSEWIKTNAALAKAEARVKELEKMFSERELRRAENRMVYCIPAMDEGDAALEVKP